MHAKTMKIAWDTFVLVLFLLHKTPIRSNFVPVSFYCNDYFVGILIEHLFFKQ